MLNPALCSSPMTCGQFIPRGSLIHTPRISVGAGLGMGGVGNCPGASVATGALGEGGGSGLAASGGGWRVLQPTAATETIPTR